MGAWRAPGSGVAVGEEGRSEQGDHVLPGFASSLTSLVPGRREYLGEGLALRVGTGKITRVWSELNKVSGPGETQGRNDDSASSLTLVM